MVVDEGNEVLHVTSSHEVIKVAGVRMNRMNQVQQVCTPCNIWKGFPCDFSLYANFTFSCLLSPQFEVSLTYLY